MGPLRAEPFQPILKSDADGFVTVLDRPGIALNVELLNQYLVASSQ